MSKLSKYRFGIAQNPFNITFIAAAAADAVVAVAVAVVAIASIRINRIKIVGKCIC